MKRENTIASTMLEKTLELNLDKIRIIGDGDIPLEKRGSTSSCELNTPGISRALSLNLVLDTTKEEDSVEDVSMSVE